jgi:hypothetical protein
MGNIMGNIMENIMGNITGNSKLIYKYEEVIFILFVIYIV